MRFLEKMARWFRIEATERGWISGYAGAIFFVAAACIVSWNLLQALVIKRAGVAWLPPFFFLSSFALYAGSWIMIRLLKNLRSMHQSMTLLIIALPLSLLFAVAQQFFTPGAPPIIVVPFMVLGLFISSGLLYVGWHKFHSSAADILNVEQMQRLEPLLVSTGGVSTFAASLLVAGISQKVSGIVLFLLIPALLICALPFFWSLHQRMKKEAVRAPVVDPLSTDVNTVRRWGLRRYIQDPQLRRFVYLLGGIIGLSMVFERIFSFGFAVAVNSQFPSEAALNAFVGKYTAFASLGMLVFVNTIQRWLLARFGLTKNLFVPPLVVLVGVFAVIGFPIFPAVVIVTYIREVVVFLQKSAYQIMLEGLSDYERSQAWSWVNGPAVTIGNLLGSLLLSGISFVVGHGPVADVIRFLAWFAFGFLILRIVLTTLIRRIYPTILLNSLRQNDFKTRVRTMEALAELRFMKERHLDEVLDVVRSDEEPVELRIAALRTVSAIQDPSALRVVSKVLRSSDAALRREALRTVASFHYTFEQLYELGFSRHTLITLLKQAFVEEHIPEAVDEILDALISLKDPEIVSFLLASLKDPSVNIRRSCIHSLRLFHDPGIIDYIRPFLTDANPELRAMAVTALWQFPWEREASLRPVLEALLHMPITTEEHRLGLYVVGALHLKEAKASLMEALRDSSEQNRVTAAIALLKLGDESGVPILRDVLRRSSDIEVSRVERLTTHPDVSPPQRTRMNALIHQFHLHYPGSLPVSEPLRIRLRNIPRECLEALRTYYQSAAAAEDLRKIDTALRELKDFPSVRGTAVCVGLGEPWRSMASVMLLAQGILVRHSVSASNIRPDEIIIGNAEDQTLPENALLLTAKSRGLLDRETTKSHYAPSELLANARHLFPQFFYSAVNPWQ